MKPSLKVLSYRHHPKYKFVLDLRAFKKGRKFFKARAEAEAEALRQRTLLERHSRALIGLSQREMSEIIAAKQKLAEYGETITDAVRHRVDHLERVRRCNITASQLADEVIEAKRRDGMSVDYLDDLQLRLRRFCRDFGNRPIAGITVEELDNWLRNLDGSPKSRSNYRANVSVMFGYAAKRRMLDFNPDVVPMLAIGAFAGLREAEIKRLDWSEIDLARGHIEIKAAKAKSARRRIVPIQPNLAAWLRPYAGLSGRVVLSDPRRKLGRVREEAGLVRWPNNGLRHSFASYRLAAIHDAPRVAAELGHTSPQMLYSTYRELVLPEEAERYWKIAPAAETENVVAFSAAAQP